MIYSALAIAAMVSCTSQEELIENGDLVEIKLQGGISAVETKAPLATNAVLNPFTLLRYDAESKPDFTTAQASTEQYEAASMTEAGAITIATTSVYYDKEGKNTYFAGFYPNATTLPASATNEIKLNIDGKTDILATNLIDAGNKGAPATTKKLQFSHMLSQLVFEIKAVTAEDVAYFGTVTSITLKDQATSGTLKLSDNSAFTADESSKGDISVYKKDATPETTTLAWTLPTDAAQACGYALVAPQTTTPVEYTLEVTTSGINTPQTIKVKVNENTTPGGEGAAPAGKKTTITLTFSQRLIEGTSGAISEWENGGGNGSGEAH